MCLNKRQLLSFGQTLFDGAKGISGSLLTIILAIITAGALLSGDTAQNLGRRFSIG